MYNFIFWFFYKFFEWRKGFKSVFLSAAMVGLSLIIHLLLLYSVIRYFTGLSIGNPGMKYGDIRILYLPLVIAIFIFIYYGYYKRRASLILERQEGKKFLTVKNIVLVILIVIVPVVLTISFTNKVIPYKPG